MLTPDAEELGCGVLGDLSLDVLDVTLIKIARLVVFEHHEVDVFFRG